MKFPNRLVLSAMAGINDADFCLNQSAGLVILGGFNIDKKSITAARNVIKRGRREFIYENPLDFIHGQLEKIKKRKKFAVNARGFELQAFVDLAKLVDDYGGILEVNAHCRQPEFIASKCGEWLLFNLDHLLEIVEYVSKFVITSVKIRGGYRLDYKKISESLFRAGAHIIHIDAMIPKGRCNYSLVSEVSKFGFTIGNNSFVDIQSGEKMIFSGASMASAARAVLKDPRFFEKMLESKILSQPVEL